jgi:hypothetical protein
MTGSGAKPNSYSMGVGALSSVGKFPVSKIIILFLVENEWPCMTTPTCTVMACIEKTVILLYFTGDMPWRNCTNFNFTITYLIRSVIVRKFIHKF